MNIAAVMDELGAVLAGVPTLRVHPWTRRQVNPPEALLALPDIDYDSTYGRGSDTLELDITVLVGAASDRASRDTIARYADGAGPHSIKQALDAHAWTTCDEVTVVRCEFATVTVAAVDYLGAVFTTRITGAGGA